MIARVHLAWVLGHSAEGCVSIYGGYKHGLICLRVLD